MTRKEWHKLTLMKRKIGSERWSEVWLTLSDNIEYEGRNYEEGLASIKNQYNRFCYDQGDYEYKIVYTKTISEESVIELDL